MFKVLVSLLLTLNIITPCSSVSIVNFEQVTAGWVAVLVSSIRKKNILEFRKQNLLQFEGKW